LEIKVLPVDRPPLKRSPPLQGASNNPNTSPKLTTVTFYIEFAFIPFLNYENEYMIFNLLFHV